MALHFHKTPIVLSASTLKNLVSRYKEYTKKTDPTVDEESYEKCRSAITPLKSGIRQIREGRENLQKLYNEIRDEYKNCTNKSEKKDLMLKIKQIEDESQLQMAIAEANDLIFMLAARLDENSCILDRMSAKLGCTARCTRGGNQNSDEVETQNTQNDYGEQNSNHNESEPSTSQSGLPNSVDSVQNQTEQCRYRSRKPPQASLPKFHRDAEDFAEYLAIFETLVHKSKELEVMEKILLLKKMLRGRAQIAIKDVKLIPGNYDWIIKTLQETYCNKTTNRSQKVQKLVNMRPANNSADSCSSVFDQIQVLVNQMISAGYDVRNTCDPIWCETITAKFPQDIIKPVLISGQALEQQTIEYLLPQIKKEVAAKGYIENRLDHSINNEVSTSKEKYTS